MDRVFGQKKVMAYLPRLSWQQVVVCSLSMTMTAGTLQASDLDIYKGGTSGRTTILMMLDTSGSMGPDSIIRDYNNNNDCTSLSENASVTYNGVAYSYKRNYCNINGKKYDRLSRLKDALMTSFSDTSISDSVAIGLGQFSSVVDSRKSVDGISGRIIVPAKPLNSAQRVALLTAVQSLNANGGTPTAAAYAEAGAYMLGTLAGGYANDVLGRDALAVINQGGTKNSSNDGFNGGTTLYFKCTQWRNEKMPDYNVGTTQVNTNKYLAVTGATSTFTQQCLYNPWDGDQNGKTWSFSELSNLPVGQLAGSWQKLAGYEDLDTLADPNGPYSYSGGKYRGYFYVQAKDDAVRPANPNASSGFKYSVDTAKNAARNAYASPIPQPVDSCNGHGIYFLTDGLPNGTQSTVALGIMKQSLTTSGFAPSFSCSSQLADTNSGSSWKCIGSYAQALYDPTKNPQRAQIKTAVVGFGSVFASASSNGTVNCAAATNTDVQNACNWGKKNDTGGYGNGGFYYANNTSELTDSINSFVNSFKVDLKPSSFGNITIPRDPLDQTQVVADGYYPMIEPSTDTSRLIWRGNLKKYYVTDGTLKDANGNPLYQVDLASSALTLNPLARDQWALIQTSATPDYSPIDVGGAWNQIPVPSALVKNGDPSNNTAARGVYVTIGGVLKAVTKDNVTTVGSGDLSTLTMEQRIGLLGYLGYQVTDTQKNALLALTTDAARQTELKKIVATVPSSPYRFLGGVVHSTPLLLNQSATVDDSGTVTAQKQYVVYGSMEGGLHVVDAATGQEQSVFLVDEVLADTSKLKVLNNPLATGSGLNYGVDAPWATDNSFKVDVSDTGTVSYIAKDMNVYGGLRMGGMSLYGLNLSTVTAPTLKFRITPDSTGFDRMTQIWSKPVVAYVRVKGKRAKVLIFGGGYDPSKYEVNGSATAAIPPTGDIKGNALYIVNAEDGSLLWSASSSNTETASGSQKLKQADVKYSVVGTPNVRDYNNDGLADAIYFADLGGQVFRVDLNNAANKSTDTVPSVVRVQTLAKLNPKLKLRFYERPAAAVFDDGSRRFVLVSVVSGNRSYPLQNDASVNRIYGLLDYDAAADDLEKDSFKPASTITEADLVSGSLGTSSAASAYTPISDADVTKQKPTSATVQPAKRGWYYDVYAGKSAGVAKVLDEPAIVSSHLYANVYDPTVTPTGTANACTGGVQGMSQSHRICLPYGNCVAYANQKVQGINTTALGPVNTNAGSKSNSIRVVQPNPIKDETCVGTGCDTTATAKPYQYTNRRNIRIARWFEW